MLAVDIGTCTIKLLEAHVNGNKVKVIKEIMFESPEAIVEDGKILDVNQVCELIRRNIIDNKIAAKSVVFTVNTTAMIIRDILVPKTSEKELKKMILIEAENQFPVDLKDYVFDHKIIEEIKNEKGTQYNVMIAAVPLSIVEDYTQLSKQCGLNLYAIDFSGNCILKLIAQEMSKKSKEEYSVAVLDMGCMTTTISIISNGVLRFNRILLYGGCQLSFAIGEKLQISKEEAEIKKKSKDFMLYSEDDLQEEEQKMMVDSIKSVLTALIDDINLYIDFYQSRVVGNHVNKIYLVGGGAQLRGIEKYLSETINIPVQKIKKLDSISFTKKRNIEELIEHLARRYEHIFYGVDENYNSLYLYYANCIGALLRK